MMSHIHAPFSIGKFSAQVVAQLAVLLLVLRYAAPTTWSPQIEAGPGFFALAFLSVHLFICFFEWGFHRYVLHGVVHQWLTRFSRGHRHHHALTAIQLQPNEAGAGRFVLNRYPIIEEAQHEDAAFPPYALAAFWILFTPLLLLVQQLLPRAPVLLGGYSAIAWSMFSYEVFHAIEHYPYEWWKAATEHPRFGFIWKRVYGFHHFHHANISTNEAISGFFGLPVADWIFRTYNQPPELLLQGRIATAKEFAVHPPWPFVAWLDRWTRRREASITHARKTSR